MQPGLEKVYFTLQEELLKPQVQIKFNDTIDNIVLQPAPLAPSAMLESSQASSQVVKPFCTQP